MVSCDMKHKLVGTASCDIVMEPGDDEEAVKKAVTDGISQSFRDGTFSSAIPSDTVICPTRGGVKLLRLRARKR
jgi:hypothetical protein